MVVVCGPGGVGKGTVVTRLVQADPHLWLSRSWTTRTRRAGESADAYVFVSREEFLRHAHAGGFLEWTEFKGNLYGTPVPDPPPGADIVLEIEVDGAAQVRRRHPDALVVLLVPPSPEVQAERMRRRGDSEDLIAARVAIGREEVEAARALADHVVVNDDLDRAVAQVAGIISARRARGD